MVEDRVQRGAAGFAAGAALDAGWESAVAALKAPLDATFEALPAAAPLLALKDYVFLACSALGDFGKLPSDDTWWTDALLLLRAQWPGDAVWHYKYVPCARR